MGVESGRRRGMKDVSGRESRSLPSPRFNVQLIRNPELLLAQFSFDTRIQKTHLCCLPRDLRHDFSARREQEKEPRDDSSSTEPRLSRLLPLSSPSHPPTDRLVVQLA